MVFGFDAGFGWFPVFRGLLGVHYRLFTPGITEARERRERIVKTVIPEGRNSSRTGRNLVQRCVLYYMQNMSNSSINLTV